MTDPVAPPAETVRAVVVIELDFALPENWAPSRVTQEIQELVSGNGVDGSGAKVSYRRVTHLAYTVNDAEHPEAR